MRLPKPYPGLPPSATPARPSPITIILNSSNDIGVASGLCSNKSYTYLSYSSLNKASAICISSSGDLGPSFPLYLIDGALVCSSSEMLISVIAILLPSL